MKTRYISLGLLLAAVAFSAHAQNRTAFAGVRNAIDYNYGGVNTNSEALRVNSAPAVTGSGTVTIAIGSVTAGDGTVFMPLNVNAPVNIGSGSNTETVTPTAVSCSTPAVYGTCSFTATFANLHGQGDLVTSGTYGLQEAIDIQSGVGGAIALSPGWYSAGGTVAIVRAAAAFSNVWLEDHKVASASTLYWSMQPTTLTTITAPGVLTSTTATFGGTGTWSTSTYYLCQTYVDALGGESACNATGYNVAGTATSALTVTSPAASAGAVGWRMYGGITSIALAYLLPITSTNCTLTTLESVMNACAIGATGVWPTLYVSTGQLSPVALGVTNVNNPVPQSHTTFAYEPTGVPPVPFQTNFGPFGSGTIASATAGDTTVLGTVQLPTGYLNQIGRTIRLTGKIVGGATATGTMVVNAGMVWAAGVTAGAPTAVCIDTTTSALGTQNYTIPFSCTFTTNAVGATAVGSIQADSWLIAAGPSTTNIVGADTGAAAVGSLGLFSQDAVYIYLTPGTEAFTAARLMDLHIETVQ